jgi:hypothetical protein
LLTINGRTPDQGMLLLSADATDAASADNTLVYEAMGNSFRILSVDMITGAEKEAGNFTTLEDTRFQFAFVDWITPPTLGLPNFLSADFNHDGQVNNTDLQTWKTNYGASSDNAHGDATGDGKVDGADFLVWQRQLGQLPSGVGAAGAVPEPSAVVLGLMSLSLIAGLRRREC